MADSGPREPGASQSPRRQYDVGIESRRRILDAAEELIAERGFDKTSIIEISRRSGVSRGSIPWHFENKAGILLAVVDRVTERGLALEGLREDEVTPGLVFGKYAELARGGGARLLFAVLSEAVTSTGAMREQYQRYYAAERAKFVAWLELEEVPEPDRQPLAAATFSGLLGATVQWLVDPNDVDLDDILTSLATTLETRILTLRGH